MTASRDAVLTALKTVTDPATGTDIVASGVMRALNVDDAGAVRFVMEIPPAQAKAYEDAKARILTEWLRRWGKDGCTAVLNVDDDHIGIDGIRDIEDFARIKDLVTRAARKFLVLNADDEHCVAIAAESKVERVCYVTAAPDHGPVAAQHIASSGMAITLRPGDGGPAIHDALVTDAG